MKAIYPLLFVFVVCLSQTALAQEFAPVGAEWYYSHYYLGGSAPNDYTHITVLKDTIVAGKNCRKLVRNIYGGCDAGDEAIYVYSEYSAVYFWSPGIKSFQILFDFGKKKGEKWQTRFKDDVLGEYIYTVNVNESYMEINNGKTTSVLDVWYTLSGSSGYSSKIFSRIGDIKNFMNYTYPFCDGDFTSGIRCYSDSANGFRSFDISRPCDYVSTGVNEMPQSFTQIFPNPTTGLLDILPSDNQPYMAQLTDIAGQVLLSKPMQNKSQLDLSALPAGVYLLTLAGSENSKAVMKVFKQ